jgi:hypothetical protein
MSEQGSTNAANFCFSSPAKEIGALRSQIATLKISREHRNHSPYVI